MNLPADGRPTRSPSTIVVAGQAYRILPGKVIAVVRLSITATEDGVETFEAPEDLLVDHITAWSEDTAGLAGCRIGWTTDSQRNADFIGADKDTSFIYPVANTLFTNADVPKLAPWNLVFRKGDARRFVAQNVSGTAPYDVELTLQMRRLRAA